jgi:uncharacterized protein YqgV (UPF0045/DUF77 family)
MQKFKKVFETIFTFVIAVTLTNISFAQCVTFNDSPNGESALKAHSVYRTYLSSAITAEDLAKLSAEDFKIAFDNWKFAYEAAPAADGQRPSHWRDGRKLYTYMMIEETDEAKKKEYFELVLRMYDEEQSCYKTKGLPGYSIGRKAFDMFYGIGAKDNKMRGSYEETAEVLAEAIKIGGNKTEYIVLDPYARIVVYQFSHEKMDKETARAIHAKLNAIADHNIKNNKALKSQFEYAKSTMNQVFAQIERNIFDCEYFIAKLKPGYPGNEENAEFLREAITTLKQQGCEAETSPFLAELEGHWAKYAEEENAKNQAIFEANNPGVFANRLYKEENYEGAIEKYREAIEGETDNEKKSAYYYSIASIQFRKLGSKSAARSSALKAAELRGGWGKPYLMIGDMYASSTRSCGDAPWEQRMVVLAAIDKYAYARRIDNDPEVQEEANRKIGKYSDEKPAKGDVFMAGYKEGGNYKIGCWIGESVTIRVN